MHRASPGSPGVRGVVGTGVDAAVADLLQSGGSVAELADAGDLKSPEGNLM